MTPQVFSARSPDRPCAQTRPSKYLCLSDEDWKLLLVTLQTSKKSNYTSFETENVAYYKSSSCRILERKPLTLEVSYDMNWR